MTPSRTKNVDKAMFANGEWILLSALAGRRLHSFRRLRPASLTLANLMEILRFSVELGLLAVASDSGSYRRRNRSLRRFNRGNDRRHLWPALAAGTFFPVHSICNRGRIAGWTRELALPECLDDFHGLKASGADRYSAGLIRCTAGSPRASRMVQWLYQVSKVVPAA